MKFRHAVFLIFSTCVLILFGFSFTTTGRIDEIFFGASFLFLLAMKAFLELWLCGRKYFSKNRNQDYDSFYETPIIIAPTPPVDKRRNKHKPRKGIASKAAKLSPTEQLRALKVGEKLVLTPQKRQGYRSDPAQIRYNAEQNTDMKFEYLGRHDKFKSFWIYKRIK